MIRERKEEGRKPWRRRREESSGQGLPEGPGRISGPDSTNCITSPFVIPLPSLLLVFPFTSPLPLPTVTAPAPAQRE